MTRRIGWIGALVFVIGSPVITPPHSASALSVIAPENAEQMVQKSDLIVIGDVQDLIETAETRFDRNSRGEVTGAYSTVRVRLRKVFKGNPKIREILVGQPVVWGTSRNGKRYARSIDVDVKPFKKARYLLFLKKGLGADAYFPVGIVYGKYNLDGKDQSEENLQWTGFQEMRKVVRQRYKE